MAIKITKPGQTVFHGFCDYCGCEFTYELIDLKLDTAGNKVSCPTCGKDYLHPIMHQPPGSTGIYKWPSYSTDPCAGCVWREHPLGDPFYVGDPPCAWCSKGRVVNLTEIDTHSIKDCATPDVNNLDSTLSSTSIGATNVINNERDATED